MSWKYVDAEHRIVVRNVSPGVNESCLASALPVGTPVDPYSLPLEYFSPVSPRQIRQALTASGLRSVVEAAVASGTQDIKDWYEFSTSFDRYNPQVLDMAAALDISDLQLDQLWRLAATL